MSDDLHLEGLDIVDLARIADQALASLNAKINDPNEPDEELGPLITATCNRWDELADLIPGFRDDPDADDGDVDEAFVSKIEAQDAQTIAARLEYLRGELRAERIAMSELIELQGLAEHIDPGDVELLEAAGVPEHPDTDEDVLREERGRLWNQLQAQGGRGVELAERIDEIDAMLGDDE